MNVSSLIDRAIIVGALALGAYLVSTNDAPTRSELEARKNNVLAAFDPQTIESLSWSFDDVEVSLRRDQENGESSTYFLGKAGTRRADEAVVRELISALDFSTWGRQIHEGGAGQFGFEQPQLELRIEAGARSYRLLFGKSAPSPARSVYLKVEGTNVDTAWGAVDLEMLEKLKRRPQEFYGGLVFPLGKSATTALSLQRGDDTLDLTASDVGFVIERKETPAILADRSLLDLVFFQLSRAKISTYLQGQESPFSPTVTVIQTTQEGKYIVDLGGECPDDPQRSILARRRSPDSTLGCVPRSIVTAFMVSADEMVAKTASTTNPDEIDHVIVQSEERSLDIMRSGSDYKLLSRQGDLIPQETGDEFFKGYSQRKLPLLEGRPDGIEKSATVTLKGQRQANGANGAPGQSDRTHQDELEIYRDEDRLFVLRLADQVWLEVPPDSHWLFLTDDDWARDKKLSHWKQADITRVSVSSPSGFEQSIERTENGFVMGGTEETADPSLTRDVLHELTTLAAVRFLSPARERPETGLWEISFDVKQGGSAKSQSIWLGDRVRGGYLAWSTIAEGTFVFPLEARIPFDTPLLDRRDFHIDPSKQKTLELTLDSRSFSFERQAGTLRAASGEATDDMAAPLVAAIESIRVVSTAGDHPKARSFRRGEPVLTITGTQHAENAVHSTTLHFGPPVVWRGTGTRLCWIEGGDENYFIAETSLTELLELL